MTKKRRENPVKLWLFAMKVESLAVGWRDSTQTAAVMAF